MRRTALAVLALALAACNDSTDIAGTYLGNATYTVAPPQGTGATGAGSATITIADQGAGDGVNAILGPDCTLAAAQIAEVDISDHGATGRFVFTSDALDAGQACALPIRGGALGLTITEGDLVAMHGLTLQLQLGGTITAAPDAADVGGYAVYQFAGATR